MLPSRLLSRRLLSTQPPKIATKPASESPAFNRSFREHLTRSRPQLTLIALSFGLCVVGGQNVGLTNDVRALRAELAGRGPKPRVAVDGGRRELAGLEVAQRVGNMVLAECASSWLGGSSLSKCVPPPPPPPPVPFVVVPVAGNKR